MECRVPQCLPPDTCMSKNRGAPLGIDGPFLPMNVPDVPLAVTATSTSRVMHSGPYRIITEPPMTRKELRSSSATSSETAVIASFISRQVIRRAPRQNVEVCGVEVLPWYIVDLWGHDDVALSRVFTHSDNHTCFLSIVSYRSTHSCPHLTQISYLGNRSPLVRVSFKVNW